MVLPKKTLVALAGQNAWHSCTGLALPRAVSGKYLPSQLRTQKAAPPPEAAGRGGGAGCWLKPNRSAKKLPCGAAFCCCFWLPPKNTSNRLPADAARGDTASRVPSAAA